MILHHRPWLQHMSGVIWKTIPYFTRYKVSDQGEVWSTVSQRILKSRPNVYGYPTLMLTDDTGKRRCVRVHRLVCMAHHGVPEEHTALQVNHKDGIKTNNRADNLEWCTQSENNLHASESGLLKSTYRVDVVDLVEKKTRRFHSLASLGRWLGLTEVNDILRLLRLNHKDPYKDRYLFKVCRAGTSKKRSKRGVAAYDFTTNRLSITDSILEMSLDSKINIASIKKAIKRKRLCNGIYFWYTDYTDYDKDIKTFTDEDVATSVDQYRRKTKAMYQSYVVKNYRTGETRSFSSFADIADYTGLSVEQVGTFLKKQRRYPILGYYIKKDGVKTPFPEFSDDMVEASCRGIIRKGKPVCVTVLKTGEKSCWPSLYAAAKYLGVAHKTLTACLSGNHRGDTYLVRYIEN